MKYAIFIFLILVISSHLIASDNKKQAVTLETVIKDIKAHLLREEKTPSAETLPGFEQHYKKMVNQAKLESLNAFLRQSFHDHPLQKTLEDEINKAIKEVAKEKFESSKK